MILTIPVASIPPATSAMMMDWYVAAVPNPLPLLLDDMSLVDAEALALEEVWSPSSGAGARGS